MYRQFCKNLKYYLDINKSNSYRYRIGKEIEVLSNLGLYYRLKASRNIEYFRISNFIYEISSHENPDIKKFIWELWAYGFEIEKFDDIGNEYVDDEDKMRDKIKLIDLLLGTHYWN